MTRDRLQRYVDGMEADLGSPDTARLESSEFAKRELATAWPPLSYRRWL